MCVVVVGANKLVTCDAHTQVLYAARGILLSYPTLLMLVLPTREAQLVQKNSRDPHAGEGTDRGSYGA